MGHKNFVFPTFALQTFFPSQAVYLKTPPLVLSTMRPLVLSPVRTRPPPTWSPSTIPSPVLRQVRRRRRGILSREEDCRRSARRAMRSTTLFEDTTCSSTESLLTPRRQRVLLVASCSSRPTPRAIFGVCRGLCCSRLPFRVAPLREGARRRVLCWGEERLRASRPISRRPTSLRPPVAFVLEKDPTPRTARTRSSRTRA